MTHVISSLIPALILSFGFIMTMDFILGLIKLTRNTQSTMNNDSFPQQQVEVKFPATAIQDMFIGPDNFLDFPEADYSTETPDLGGNFDFPATLNWISGAALYGMGDDEEVVEEVDIISLAKSRLPVVAIAQEIVQSLIDFTSLNIRELKKLASERKIKGYGKMKKAELIAALS